MLKIYISWCYNASIFPNHLYLLPFVVVGAVTLSSSYLYVMRIVIACKRIESSQLRPADTEFLLCLLHETTNICSHQWDAQKVKGQNTWRLQKRGGKYKGELDRKKLKTGI